MLLKKHGIKLFFAASCVLMMLSLVLSAYSYAKYVTLSKSTDAANTAAMDCKVQVENGGGESFIR